MPSPNKVDQEPRPAAAERAGGGGRVRDAAGGAAPDADRVLRGRLARRLRQLVPAAAQGLQGT